MINTYDFGMGLGRSCLVGQARCMVLKGLRFSAMGVCDTKSIKSTLALVFEEMNKFDKNDAANTIKRL